jgi:hypothetical protein
MSEGKKKDPAFHLLFVDLGLNGQAGNNDRNKIETVRTVSPMKRSARR